jgi:hypothetical protein
MVRGRGIEPLTYDTISPRCYLHEEIETSLHVLDILVQFPVIVAVNHKDDGKEHDSDGTQNVIPVRHHSTNTETKDVEQEQGTTQENYVLDFVPCLKHPLKIASLSH